MLCSRVQNLLSAYFDQELGGAEMLSIRRHLSDCPACRREHDALRQVKSLMGSLAAVEARRPFNPAILDVPFRPAHRPTRLALWMAEAREWFPTLAGSTSRLAWGGVLAVSLLAAAVVSQPQDADAVTAHVPEVVAIEEIAPGPSPFQEVSFPAAEPASYTYPRVRPGYPFPYPNSPAQPASLVSYGPGRR
jgi:anti-sigma factor RsiW